MITKAGSTLSEIEERVKAKLLEVLERVIDDPLLVPEEWKTLFGEASVMRAMSIVAKLKDRPADDKKTKQEAHVDEPLTLEEKRMWRDHLTYEIEREERERSGH